MKLTDMFIKRPVFATVLNLMLLLIGLAAYQQLPVRQFPMIESEVIGISTGYPGASANLIEGFVTTPLESALSGIEGLDYLGSKSSQGSSMIQLHLKLGADINKALTDVSDKVSSVRWKLPKEINDPVIFREDPNAEPTLYIAFSSAHKRAEEITDYLSRVVQPQLGTLPGVAEAKIFGKRPYAMRLWLDPQKMAAYHVTAGDVEAALVRNNIQSAAGRIEGELQEFNVTAATDLRTTHQFNNLVIKSNAGAFIRLKDIGYARLGASDGRSSAIINGQHAVVMAIIIKPTANPLVVSKEMMKLFPSIQAQFPKDLNGSVLYDASKVIAKSLEEVTHTVFIAIACVILVIFCFLGSLRTVLIPVVTIPLSIFGICGMMKWLGYTINTITLLAWVLSIGLVVDDAIVVVENIHRLIKKGIPPVQAAITGIRQIRFAIIAMTLTLAAVYAPIGFLSGLVGTLFREFAFTLSGAVIISGFIALTLSPMLCSKLIVTDRSPSKLSPEDSLKRSSSFSWPLFSRLSSRWGLFLTRFSNAIESAFSSLTTLYQRLLKRIFRVRWWVIGSACFVYFGCWFLATNTHSELAPQEDDGFIVSMVQAPASANLKYTEQYTKKMQPIYEALPERLGYGIINGFSGVNSALSFLVLKPREMRTRSAQEISEALRQSFWNIPGVLAFSFLPPPLPGASGLQPISFVLKTTGSYQHLQTVIQKLLKKARQNPKLVNLDTDLKFNKPQINVLVNRNRAADLGVSMQSISETLNLLMGEPTVTRFVMDGRSYAVIPKLQAAFIDDPDSLTNIQLRSEGGDLVPLSNLIQLERTVVPQSLNHFQQMRSATLTGSVVPGYPLGDALKDLRTATSFPDDINFSYSGQSRQFQEASGSMQQLFFYAVLFIFLVLAAQFESFRDPFIVMLSVPLSIAGALVVMRWTNSTLNIYTQIGLVTLIGLISKHGILIVEFANQLQAQGRTMQQAVVESACTRLRPILMTTATMIMSALPLALTSGAGSQARRQIGWVLIGGMSFGTVLTLLVVPVAYILLAKQRTPKQMNKNDDVEEIPCYSMSDS